MRERHGPGPTLSALVGGAFAVAALSGCGGQADNPLGLPSLGAVVATSTAVPAPATATASTTPVSTSGDVARTSSGTGSGTFGAGAQAELGRLTGSAKAHPGMVRLVVDYMDVRVRIANSWRVDTRALGAVATGRAARAARDRAAVMQSGDRHTVGSYLVNASTVVRSGDRATVTGCMVDRTSEVDAAGQVLVDPPGGRLVTIELLKAGGRWRVGDVPRAVPPLCTGPSTGPSKGPS